MALQSMTALASITLPTASASVSFSDIPQNYRDLVLVVNGTPIGGNPLVIVRLNLDSGTNYPQVFLWATTVAQSGTNSTSGHAICSTSVLAGARFNGIVNIMDYSATNKHKTFLSRSAYTSSASITVVETSATRWANTSAVTAVEVVASVNSFALGSTFSLYGRIG